MELTDMENVVQQEIPQRKDSLCGIRVLLAEDNDLNAEIAEIQLEELGMTVTRAADGKQAVGLFVDSPAGTFDVILMDIMMPQMNGYEATKAIRRIQNRPDALAIPIIAMTANAFAEDVQASLDAGMNGHLSKPIVMDEVVKTIARNLGQHRIMGQGDSAKDFDPSESMENAGILDVFPIFHTARLGQKIRRSPQLPLCGVALDH